MNPNKQDARILRHTAWSIFIHWVNAVCWLFLLATGLALIQNPELQILGGWWSKLLSEIFGGRWRVLAAHWGVGLVWTIFWVAVSLIGLRKNTWPFLREILTFRYPQEAVWLVKKNLQMIFGDRIMARLVKPLGWDEKIPASGFYNPGQKAAAWSLVLGGLVLAVTGLILLASKYALNPGDVVMVQWSMVVHFMAAGLTTAVLIVHIYMAAVSREERPAFISMLTGCVPEDYARQHHGLWFTRLEQEQSEKG